MPIEPHDSSRPEGADARVGALEAILDDREGKLREATALYEHAKRELPLVKARIERASRDEVQSWKETFLLGFLDLLDDVDRARAATRTAGSAPAVREGLELLASRFSAQLAEVGVERVRDTGRFDPHLHEAVSTAAVASAADDSSLTAVIAPGYRFGGRVLRPARVVVGLHDER